MTEKCPKKKKKNVGWSHHQTPSYGAGNFIFVSALLVMWNKSIDVELEPSLSVREIMGSITGAVKSDTVSSRLATAAMFLRDGRVARTLGCGDGLLHS